MGIYILSVFLSAFLIFQVQPLIGKYLLPWFGGTSGIWSTILLFFQTLLTAGYAYAYWLIRRRPRSKQSRYHLLLVILSMSLLAYSSFGGSSPILPDPALRPIHSQMPVWDILKLLTIFIGLPGLVLSANSTLVQTWFSLDSPQKSPYWLYALSNTGSLLALLSYPLFIERNFSLQIQAWIWACFYLVFCIITILLLTRMIRDPNVAHDPGIQNPEPETTATPRQHQFLWVGLSAAGSIALLSTTSQMTQEVAPIPLLWVLPLGIYLFTFVLSFSNAALYHRPLNTFLLTLSSAGIINMIIGSRPNFYLQIAIYSLFLFSACMIAHGELFRLRPHPSRLSKFYLSVSAGGVLGGITVNLIAPQLFKGYWEFYLGWIMIFTLLVISLTIYPTKELKVPWRRVFDLAVILQTLIILWFSLRQVITASGESLIQTRNFYGVSKVVHNQYRDAIQYVNGSTIHGFQLIAPEKRNVPTAYFWRGSGIAMVIRNHPKYDRGLKVGVLGLGIGTLAAHGRAGDCYRFYEIDPIVIDLALGKYGYFSYLKDSPAEITLVPGDARISLMEELNQGKTQEFDLLVMDAFNSDSVPTHLLTREAFELYQKHLAPGGVIAVNISNNYIDLEPVLWSVAQALNLEAILIDPPVQSYHPIASPSRWVFLSQELAVLDNPEINANAESLDDSHPGIRLWTDAYSSIFGIIRR